MTWAGGTQTVVLLLAAIGWLIWVFEQKTQLVDLKFCDLFGSWQHMTLPIGAFGTSAFTEGLGFDGSFALAGLWNRSMTILEHHERWRVLTYNSVADSRPG